MTVGNTATFNSDVTISSTPTEPTHATNKAYVDTSKSDAIATASADATTKADAAEASAIATASTDATAKANAAQSAAISAAATDATTKADAAEASAIATASADATAKANAAEASAIATASADATAKANAAEASAISAVTNGAGAAFDTLKEIQDVMATDAELSSAIASVTSAAASTASADATSKANAAQSAAISAAASDATSKANAALASALAADSDTTYSAGPGLDLNGTTFRIENDLRGEAWVIGRDNNDYINVDTTQIDFVLDGAVDMRLYNNGDLHVDGNVIAYSNTISDERLKTDVVKIDGALDKVDQINGYTFTYTADGKKSAGVIAQEVEKVLPSAITESTLPLKMGEDDTTEYKTVQYDQLIGLLVEAVKELKAEVAELRGS
jgi:hypothetical protein